MRVEWEFSIIERILEASAKIVYGDNFIQGNLTTSSCECCGSFVEYEIELKEETADAKNNQ